MFIDINTKVGTDNLVRHRKHSIQKTETVIRLEYFWQQSVTDDFTHKSDEN